jgi:hypothetical protein
MSIFDDIKSRLDIKDVYTHYTGNRIERHNKALCVFHRDTHPSLSFKGQIFKCFVCDKGGDVFKFMEYYLGLKGIEAARRLNEDFRLGLIQPAGRRDRRRELLENKRRIESARRKRQAGIEQWEQDLRKGEIDLLYRLMQLNERILKTDEQLQMKENLREIEQMLDEVEKIYIAKDMEKYHETEYQNFLNEQDQERIRLEKLRERYLR